MCGKSAITKSHLFKVDRKKEKKTLIMCRDTSMPILASDGHAYLLRHTCKKYHLLPCDIMLHKRAGC